MLLHVVVLLSHVRKASGGPQYQLRGETKHDQKRNAAQACRAGSTGGAARAMAGLSSTRSSAPQGSCTTVRTGGGAIGDPGRGTCQQTARLARRYTRS